MKRRPNTLRSGFKIQCLQCRHVEWEKEMKTHLTCKAYPEGIPKEIIYGIVDHTRPHRGDGGVQFESII